MREKTDDDNYGIRDENETLKQEIASLILSQ
jgi:hypothetical protein